MVKETKNEIRKTTKPSLVIALIPLAAMGLLLGVGCGIYKIRPQVLLVTTAFSFGGIMQRTGLLSVILDRVMKFAVKVWSIVLTTIGATIITAL